MKKKNVLKYILKDTCATSNCNFILLQITLYRLKNFLETGNDSKRKKVHPETKIVILYLYNRCFIDVKCSVSISFVS